MSSRGISVSEGANEGAAGGLAATVRQRLGVRNKLTFKKNLYGVLFVAPAMLFFLIFSLYPTINGFYLSLTQYTLLKPPVFIGLDNFVGLINDDRFIKGVAVTAAFVLGTTVPKWIVSLALALLFKGSFRFKEFYKVLYFIPALLSGVVISLVWKLLFDPGGLINAYLGPLIGRSEIFWLTTPQLAPYALMIVHNWANIGFFMLIWLAGLVSIPQDFYEVAAIDGANRWHSFWHITLPLLKPTTIFVMIISMINSFQTFALQFVMTEGGPNDATATIALLIYNYGFRYFKMGQAAAMSIIMFVVIIGLTLTQMRLLRSDDTSYT